MKYKVCAKNNFALKKQDLQKYKNLVYRLIVQRLRFVEI